MAGVRVPATLSIDHADESWQGFPCIRVSGRRFAPSGGGQMLMKGTTYAFAVLGGLALLAVAALIPTHRPGVTSVPAALTQPLQAADVGYAVLPDGRGGTNVESVVYTDAMGFDKKRSLEAFRPPCIRCSAPTAPGATARRINWEVELRRRFTRMST